MTGYRKDNYSERALELLEKDICYLSYEIRVAGLSPEDVAQELRIHLWNKLHLYNHNKAGLRAWAQAVMRRKLVDLGRGTYNRRTGVPNDILDSPLRAWYEDLGDQWLASEWEMQEITITTFQPVVY